MKEGGQPRWTPWASRSSSRVAVAWLPTEISSTKAPSWVIELARSEDRPAMEAFRRAFMGEVPAAGFSEELADRDGNRAETLLCRKGREIVGLVEFARRHMYYGAATCAVAVLRTFGVLRELWHTHLPVSLVTRAESQLRGLGIPVGFLWTAEPSFWEKLGWVSIYRPTFLEANVHTLLSGLHAQGLVRQRNRRTSLAIRPARQWDWEGLAEFYKKCVQTGYGFMERSVACWKCLFSHRRFDALYVAVRTPNSNSKARGAATDGGQGGMPSMQGVVGYYFRTGPRVVELLAVARSISLDLLIHACQEAAEQSRTELLFDLVPGCRLRSVVEGVLGDAEATHTGDEPVLMAKIWDPGRMLEAIMPELLRRWQQVGRGCCSLGLLVDGRFLKVQLAEDGGRVIRLPYGERESLLRVPNLVNLVFRTPGEFGRTPVLESGWRRPDHGNCELAKFLFPPIPFWRSILDDPPFVVIPSRSW